VDLQEARKVEERIEKGAWVEVVRHFPGCSVRVRGEGNTDHERFLFEAYREVGADPSDDDHLRIEKESIEQTILTGWKGFKEEYTPENVRQYLELKTFRNSVMEAARAVGRRGVPDLETAAKNSPRRSAGNSSGERTSIGSKH
jgi:hypothetical protein